MMELLLPCFILLKVIGCVRGYPTGAPTGACEDMMPRHSGVQPQYYPRPYTILTNTRTYQPGQPITVTISGPDYRGVLLEARTFDSPYAQGSWQLPPPDTRFLQCAGNPQGAVTHSNTNVKGNTTVYSWIPPDSASPIYFMAAVAQQRAVYWIGVKSTVLTRGKPEDISLAITGASAGMAEEKPLLVLITCFLMFQMLA
uniref:putative defense protein Hdd11 n=1 Tax=Semicossyphus pulcher TaxID=241346 RepID=UPI0037E74382